MKIFLFLCLLIISLQDETMNIISCLMAEPSLQPLMINAAILYSESKLDDLLQLVLKNFKDVKEPIKNCLKRGNN